MSYADAALALPIWISFAVLGVIMAAAFWLYGGK
jgi:hypothetical protein